MQPFHKLDMKPLLSTITLLTVSLAAFSAEHRFYADEGAGDDFSPQDVVCTIHTSIDGDVENVRVTIKNNRHTPFQPVKAGILLGIDTYMDRYPDWNDKYFPTLMVCEPCHFYGYMQSPSGKIKAIASPDPVASWSLDYNLGYQDPAPHWFMGHRIKSLRLDLLAALPLPAHHPGNQWQLMPGEERSWTIKIIDIPALADFEATVSRECGVPMLHMETTSTAPDNEIRFDIHGTAPSVTVNRQPVPVKKSDIGWQACFSSSIPGIYDIEVIDGNKRAHGHINVRYPWRRTMELAREAAWRYKQKATSHVESWYGFHTAFLAARYFPCDSIDSLLNKRFDTIFNELFDSDGNQRKYDWRIQNVSSTVGMLVDRYEAYGDKADLMKARLLADRFISSFQQKDGAYRTGNTVYTSVIYPAKSILELADAEWAAGLRNDARRHERSARMAIDRLVESKGDFETEGEITYEDGMVSCSALQIGMLALRQKDNRLRRHYTDEMLKILKGHDCLTQLKVPDGRRRGGTMRYWEAQYDVHMLPNMISSPHGWSAWRAYATYYAYLLTGDERWIKETFDAASSFASLIDPSSGRLRWAFVVDPQLHVRQIAVPDSAHTSETPSYGTPHPDVYGNRKFTVGEQYVDMISDWQTVVSSDNDVHEVFKFIAEAVLDKAYVVERPDGSLGCYNCKAVRNGNNIEVYASEPQICHLFVNTKGKYNVKFDGEIIWQ